MAPPKWSRMSHVAVGEAAKKAAVLLHSQEADPFFEDQVKSADRVFYFEQG